MRPILTIVLIFLSFIQINAQDTVFITKHNFKEGIRNVFNGKEGVFVKTNEKVYLWVSDKWIDQKITATKPYVFYSESFFDADFIPTQYRSDISKMEYLIPQKSLTNTTTAKTGNHLFVCTGGSLFEYQIFPHYSKIYEDKSIRDIYNEAGLSIVSTYSGIFINDTILLKEPTYSSGDVSKINDKYFINSDALYELILPDSTYQIMNGSSVISGNARKMLQWKGNVYSLNTKSFNLVSEGNELTTIHEGNLYHDMEVSEEGILFSSEEGACYLWDGKETKELVKLDSKIRDIYVDKSKIFLSSDQGVFQIENFSPSSLIKYSDKKMAIGVMKDLFDNTWIATENGLFIKPKDLDYEIPFIEKVEFNRNALNYYNDTLFVGSIEGLFIIDILDVERNFLPLYLQSTENVDSTNSFSRTFLFVTISLVILTLSVIGFLLFRKKKSPIEVSPKNEVLEPNLEDFRNAILKQNLSTVESIAEYFHTNTVQLNRIFKNYGTTPGKFLKEIKLEHAQKLIEEGADLEKVSQEIGYSLRYIRKALGI